MRTADDTTALTSSDCLPFRRLHGCGNDYVYLNGWQVGDIALSVQQIQALADRHTGIGGDGVIWIGPAADNSPAVAEMRMWNADGSISEMCGNGLRCAVKVAFDDGRIAAGDHAIATGAGILQAHIDGDRGAAEHMVTIDMGPPRLRAADVPTTLPDAGTEQVLSVDGISHTVVAVGMGNPHCVVFVDDPQSAPVHELGPRLEHHPAFPNRTNVEFVGVLNDQHLVQRTWERGSGETMACGTGAAATAVAAMATGRIPLGTITISLLGGDLELSWDGQGHVIMRGPATAICDGTVQLEQLTGALAT